MSKLKKLLLFEEKQQKQPFTLQKETNFVEYDVRNEKKTTDENVLVSTDIEENEAYVKKRLSIPLNNDFVFRKIAMRDNRKAFVIFIEGMVNTQYVTQGIIYSLQRLPFLEKEPYGEERELSESYISHPQASAATDMNKVLEEVNFGCAAAFIDGCDKAYIFDVRGWSTRSISKPENEQSIYGPQEAFGEMLRTNTALVRKIIKSEKLIAEAVKVGNVSKTRGVLLYINDIANEKLVDEVRRRINGISTDYIIAIEEIELLIEESTFLPGAQLLGTERPDRVARCLTEGKVALILNGSPRALIFPTSVFELSHAVSDQYLRLPYANMTRILHIIASLVSILLPGLYLATTLFHQELVPTYLLYSISAARENVPFPSVLELILMDISFELVREAGLRMPSPIGSTLGIVGGLILGQAAVSAKIVSPLMIIIIAITGIGSFAISDYSLGWSFRILRLVFIILGASLGFYGIAAGMVIYGIFLASQNSFGVPFLSPLPKRSSKSTETAFFENPIWKKERRPTSLHTKNSETEPKISRKWK